MLLQLLISGLLLGGVYALLSIGLSLIISVSKFINFAHGEFVMVGGYIAYVCYTAFNMDPYTSWPIVVVGSIIFGSIVFLVIRKTIGGDILNHILITIGISMIVQNVVLMFFKSDVKSIPARFTTSLHLGEILIPINQLISFLIAATATALLLYMFNKTNLGRSMNAVGQNRVAAQLMGISVDRTDYLAFVLGVGSAAMAGSLLMTMYPTFPTVGAGYGHIAWVIVILGGVGQLLGGFYAGLIIGVVETVSGYYLGSDVKQVIYFIIFLIIILVRPNGLFAHNNIRKKKVKKT